ncbi:acyloxyacyl hydrolase [Thermodesulfobacteriota bacterium]
MSRKIILKFIITVSFLLVFFVNISSISAEEKDNEYTPTRYGISVTAGNTYDPTNNVGFYMMSGLILYDYEKIWKHRAPDGLRFKVEGSIGATNDRKTRLVSSMNIFALHYLDLFENQTFRPYVEAGIGAIYTDFQIKGQGSRINFNPQLGVGTEIKLNPDNTFFFTLRLHHISNGDLDDENRGINSVMCMLGYFFN